ILAGIDRVLWLFGRCRHNWVYTRTDDCAVKLPIAEENIGIDSTDKDAHVWAFIKCRAINRHPLRSVTLRIVKRFTRDGKRTGGNGLAVDDDTAVLVDDTVHDVASLAS